VSRAAALRLGAFAGAVALAFGAAFGIGSAIDPIAAADETSAAPAHGEEMGGMAQTSGTGEGHGGHESAGQLPGLAVSDAGYTFAPAKTSFTAGEKTELRFTIQGPDGKPVTKYTKTHEKDLHLIVVRRDLSGFHHVHPTMAADGTWSIPFTFTAGGTWRLYADFQPAGHDSTITLGTDVNVTGMYVPVPVAEPASAPETPRAWTGATAIPLKLKRPSAPVSVVSRSSWSVPVKVSRSTSADGTGAPVEVRSWPVTVPTPRSWTVTPGAGPGAVRLTSV
jgi:hypothetical protein